MGAGGRGAAHPLAGASRATSPGKTAAAPSAARRHQAEEGEQQPEPDQVIGHGGIEAQIDPGAGQDALVHILARPARRPQHAFLPRHRHQRPHERPPGIADHPVRGEALVDAREAVVQRVRALRLAHHAQRLVEALQHRPQPQPEIQPDADRRRDQQARQRPGDPREGEEAEYNINHRGSSLAPADHAPCDARPSGRPPAPWPTPAPATIAPSRLRIHQCPADHPLGMRSPERTAAIGRARAQ
jgi:hypothetical protein